MDLDRRMISGVVIVLVVVVVAGGALLVSDTSTSDASVTVDADNEVAIDETYDFTATIRNDGDAPYEDTVEIHVDGEVIESKSMSVGPGETTTVTVSHSFDSTGSYAVGLDAEQTDVETWAVEVQSVTESTADRMSGVSTVAMSQSIVGDFESSSDDGSVARYAEITTEGEYDFEDQEMHERITEYFYHEGNGDSELTEDRWYTDGTLYFRSTFGNGETEHQTYDGAFSDVEQSSVDAVAEFVRDRPDSQLEREGDEYRYTAEYTDPEKIQSAFTAAGGVNVIPPEMEVEAVTVNMGIHSEMHTVQALSLDMDVSGAESGTDVSGTLTVEVEYSNYGEPVSVTAPDAGGW